MLTVLTTKRKEERKKGRTEKKKENVFLEGKQITIAGKLDTREVV